MPITTNILTGAAIPEPFKTKGSKIVIEVTIRGRAKKSFDNPEEAGAHIQYLLQQEFNRLLEGREAALMEEDEQSFTK